MIARTFLKLVSPIVKFLGKIYVKFDAPKIDGVFYYTWRDSIYPGDVLLSNSDGYIGSNFINPSEIKHGAIYMGKDMDGICYVTEATAEGVIKKDLVSFLTTKDRIIIMRPRFPIDRNKVIPSAESRLGASYDYEFEGNDKEYYCFEHIIKSYLDQSPSLNFEKSKKFGHEYFSSDTFLESELFATIVDSNLE